MPRSAHRCHAAVLVLFGVLAGAGPASAKPEDIPAIERRMREAQAAGDLAGMMAQARRLEAVVKARFGARHLNYAIVLNNVGNAYDAQGRYAQAEETFKATIRVLETLPKQRDPELAAAVPGQLADTLVNLANTDDTQGKYAEAEAAYRRALAINERIHGPAHSRVAVNLQALAVTLRSVGRLDEAEALLRRALAIQEKTAASGDGGEIDGLAATLDTLATIALERGRLPEAQAFLARALPLRERPGGRPSGLVASLNTLAEVDRRQGRRAEAASLLQRVLAIQERLYGPDNPRIALTLNNLGVVLSDQGRTSEAEGLHRRALAIREAALAPDDPAIAQSLNNLATLYQAQGRNAEAIAAIERAIPIFEKALGPNHPTVAGNLENLAIAQRALGRLAAAEATLEHALAIQERVLGPDHPDLAGTLANLGMVYDDRGKPRPAEGALERALSIQEKALGPENPGLIATLNNLAAAYRADGEGQRALDTARRASAVILAHVPIAEAGAEGGGAAFLRQNAEFFSRHLSQLAAAAGDRRSGPVADEAFRIAQWASRSAAAGALQQSNARFAAGDGALAGRIRENQELAAAWQAKDAALTAALSAPDRSRVEGLRAEVADLRGRLTRAEADLDRAFPDYAALAHPKPLDIAAARALLASDEALVVLLPGPEDSAVFALTREGFDWHVIPFGADQLTQDVATFRRGLDLNALAASMAAGEPDLFNLLSASNFYTKLLGSTEAVFKDKPQLLVVPGGALTALPFHLLLTEKPAAAVPQEMAAYGDAAWLAKRHAVTILPSVGSLDALRALARRPPGDKPMIGFGDPVFGGATPPAGDPPPTSGVTAAIPASLARGYGDFWQGAGVDRTRLAEALPALPETATELTAVAAKLGAPASGLYLGSRATEAAVKTTALSDFRVVYFATHGLVAGDVKGLGEPSLALTLPARPSALDDGLLTASEIAGLKLGADWVVLSACNTAAGEKPGAEALSGLARAFFFAGTRALLVSHWAVDSAAATRLTTTTFARLQASPGIGRSEALRQAMLDYMRDGANPRNAYPAYWGPFSVIGEGGADRPGATGTPAR